MKSAGATKKMENTSDTFWDLANWKVIKIGQLAKQIEIQMATSNHRGKENKQAFHQTPDRQQSGGWAKLHTNISSMIAVTGLRDRTLCKTEPFTHPSQQAENQPGILPDPGMAPAKQLSNKARHRRPNPLSTSLWSGWLHYTPQPVTAPTPPPFEP